MPRSAAHNVIDGRWVLTWKDPEEEDKDKSDLKQIDKRILDAVGTKRTGWEASEARDKAMKKASTMPDGRVAKARLVLRGFQDQDHALHSGASLRIAVGHY